MTIYSFISLFSCVIIFILGNFVYYQNKRERLNIVFALYCVCMSYIAFGEFMYRQAESLETASFWLKMSALWPFNLALLLHFTLIYTGQGDLLKRKRRHFLIYLPALLFSIAAFLFTQPIREYWGYTYSRTSFMEIIGNLSGISYGFVAFFILLKYFLTVRDPKKKQQTKYILLGQLFPTFAPLVTEGFLPTLHLKIPESIVASITLFAAFTGYAIWKYELFIINTATTAENIISTMPDSLILMDPEFKILEANPSLLMLLGYQRKELIGASLALLLGQSEGRAPERAMEKIRADLFSRGLIQNFEIHYQTKQGIQIPIFFTGSVIKDKQGYIAGIVGIGSDIREIKQLQAQLFQSEKLKAVGQLAGGIAHEINNPLGVILGFAQSLAKRTNEDDALYLPLKSIEREAVRCKNLIGDLLTFSRPGKTFMESIDINQTIDETLSLITANAKARGIEITTNYEARLPRIIADKRRLQQIIINICSNAIDAIQAINPGNKIDASDGIDASDEIDNSDKIAVVGPTPKAGKINIITRHTENQIEIKISDTGSGMTEEVKKHLFEPFFTTKDIGKGTGLGLSLCYEIIEKHQGRIEVESEPGQGSTFIIKLPERQD